MCLIINVPPAEAIFHWSGILFGHIKQNLYLLINQNIYANACNVYNKFNLSQSSVKEMASSDKSHKKCSNSEQCLYLNVHKYNPLLSTSCDVLDLICCACSVYINKGDSPFFYYNILSLHTIFRLWLTKPDLSLRKFVIYAPIIIRTDSKKIKRLQCGTPGVVHGAV